MTTDGQTPWRKIPNPDGTCLIRDIFGVTMADNVHPDIAWIIVRSVNGPRAINKTVTALDD